MINAVVVALPLAALSWFAFDNAVRNCHQSIRSYLPAVAGTPLESIAFAAVRVLMAWSLAPSTGNHSQKVARHSWV